MNAHTFAGLLLVAVSVAVVLFVGAEGRSRMADAMARCWPSVAPLWPLRRPLWVARKGRT